MKPGTIVVCLPHEVLNGYVTWLPQLDEKTPYMIRDFFPTVLTGAEDSVTFEEGVIGYIPDGSEIGFPTRYVREILPADEIPEEIKERVEEPMYV